MGPLAKAWSISAIGRGFLGIEHRAAIGSAKLQTHKSGDCHKGDGPYKNKCKTPSSSSRRLSSTKPTCWLDFKCLQAWVDDEALFGDC